MEIIRYVGYEELKNFRNNDITLKNLIVYSSRDKEDKQFREEIKIILPDERDDNE